MRVLATTALALMTALSAMTVSANKAEARYYRGGAIAFGVASAVVAGIALSRYNRYRYYDDPYYDDYYAPRRYYSYGYYAPRRYYGYYGPRYRYGYYPRARGYAYGWRHRVGYPGARVHYRRHGHGHRR